MNITAESKRPASGGKIPSTIDNALSGAVAGAMLIAALLLSGCQTTQIAEHLPPPPAAELGPQFEVLKAPRYSYIISEAMDGQGRVHLIYANKTDVLHLVIGPQGLESREIIRPNYWQKNAGQTYLPVLDLAFDRAGNLHALLGTEHLVKKDGTWAGSQRTPWQEARLDPRNEVRGDIAFVKGMPDLTWVFYIRGSAAGVPTRWAWKTSGGPLGSPDVVDIWRMVVVPEETPYRHWHMLDMEGDYPGFMEFLSGGQRNAASALYWQNYIGHRRATFRADGKCAEPDVRSPWYQQLRKEPLKLADGTPVCLIEGVPFITTPPPQRAVDRSGPGLDYTNETLGGYLAYAMDDDTGTILAASGETGESLLAEEKSNPGGPVEMPIKNAGLILAPAGSNRFHALALGLEPFDWTPPLYYLAYSNGAWSAPVEIGQYADGVFRHGTTRPEEPQGDVFRVIPGKGGRALLLWPTEDGLVARWVTLK